MFLLLACDDPVDSDPSADTACEPAQAACADGVTVSTLSELGLPTSTTLPHGALSVATGDLDGDGVAEVYAGTGTTVTRLDGEGWTVATDIWTQPDDGTGIFPLVADLTADGVLDLALGLPGSDGGDGQVVVFPGPVVPPLSWDSPHRELKGGGHLGLDPAAGDFTGDGVLDLLVNGAGFAAIKPGPLLADSPFDAATDTFISPDGDAVASVHARPANLDGDGVADLVLLTQGSPGCNDLALAYRVATGPFAVGTTSAAALPALAPPPDTRAYYPTRNDALGLTSSFAPLARDLDGDGLDEVVGLGLPAGGDGLTVVEILAYASPVTAGDRPSVSLPTYGWLLALGDLTRDGAADVLVHGGTALVEAGPLAAPGAATCTVTHDLAIPASPDTAWIGDLDGDGLDETVLLQSSEADSLAWVLAGRD